MQRCRACPMHRRSKHFHELITAHWGSVPTWAAAIAVRLSPQRILGPRASWEVCPKHRNSRREIQRVRGRGSQRHALLRPPGRGSRSLRHRLSAADARHAPRSPGGFCVAAIFFLMKPTDADSTAPITRAAAYFRISTEHQQFPKLNQLDLIRQYAELHGLEIVKVYSDDAIFDTKSAGRV